jgi:hypothetical protein
VGFETFCPLGQGAPLATDELLPVDAGVLSQFGDLFHELTRLSRT